MSQRHEREIYDRHPGPYSLLVTRLVETKKGPEKQQAEIRGPMLARSAHTESVKLIEEETEKPATEVYIYSEREKMFIGAVYIRGRSYQPWPDDLPLPAPSRLTERHDEPADTSGDPAEPTEPAANEIVEPPKPKPERKKPSNRFPTVRGKGLVLNPEKSPEDWPKSAPAQLVREFFTNVVPEHEGKCVTVAEAVAALDNQLKAMGVGFPASLLSRLKQAGLIHGATSE